MKPHAQIMWYKRLAYQSALTIETPFAFDFSLEPLLVLSSTLFFDSATSFLSHSARVSVASIPRDAHDAMRFPTNAKYAGVRGHAYRGDCSVYTRRDCGVLACQGRSQSRAIGMAPNHAPTIEPTEG